MISLALAVKPEHGRGFRPSKAELKERIARAVESIASDRYRPQFVVHKKLTMDNLSVVADLLESSAASKFLPTVMNARVTELEQPALTQWFTSMEQHYVRLRTYPLTANGVGDDRVAKVISGVLVLKNEEPLMPDLSLEQEFHYMLLVLAYAWSELDHLVYTSHGAFGADMYVWEQDVFDFVLENPALEDVDRVCRILMEREVTRFAEVTAIIEHGITSRLSEGAI
jgi:hypothetical protein